MFHKFSKKKITTALLASIFFFSMMTPVFANGDTEAIHILQSNIAESIQDAADVTSRNAEVLFMYNEGQLYRVYCRPGYLTDIKLQAGEEITFVGGGDTGRWMIDSAKSGSGTASITHIYLKPTKAGIATNLIINTTSHIYRLQIESVDGWYNPIISWQYPFEVKALKQASTEKEEALYAAKSLALASPELLNFNYKINNKSKKNRSWCPETVFDDGKKTYIKLPATLCTGDAPVLFIKDGKNLALVNARMKDSYYIVDRLFDEAVMRSSSNTNDSITILRK